MNGGLKSIATTACPFGRDWEGFRDAPKTNQISAKIGLREDNLFAFIELH
jgi:hypothetical protein